MKKNPDMNELDYEPYMIPVSKHVLLDSKNKDNIVNSEKANIILWSYNRPKMLKQAVDSVMNQTYRNWTLFVIDDGSDFDVNSLLESYNSEKIYLFAYPRVSPQERVSPTREGGLGLNTDKVLQELPRGEVVYYLCDDDIMHPQWVTRSMFALRAGTDFHVAQGGMWSFYDDDLENAFPGGPNASPEELWWGAGTFCHRTDCFHDEGLRWYDNDFGHSQDLQFIMDVKKLHPNFLYVDTVPIYRREHEKSLSKLLTKREDFAKLVDIEPMPIPTEVVDGYME